MARTMPFKFSTARNLGRLDAADVPSQRAQPIRWLFVFNSRFARLNQTAPPKPRPIISRNARLRRIVLTCAIWGQMIQHVPDAALQLSHQNKEGRVYE
jgi:hypothetical protein